MGEPNVIKIVPSIFAESTYLLDGKPFRLTNRHYLKEIYDADISESIIMSGRQVEKSTTNSVDIANNTLLIPNFKALYVAPLTKQVSVFSKERLGKLYRFSANNVIAKKYMGPKFADNVSHKELSNGSTVYLEHCFDLGDNIRGISTNGIWFDEIQDIHIDAIPVVRETQSHAYDSGAGIKLTRYTGTPKTFANTIQQYWERSTQNEWIVRCPHCGTYQILGVKNLEPHQYICRKCKMNLPDAVRINGFWHPTKRTATMKGYRISQMMVPWIRAEELWGKLADYSVGKFNNECLGRSYEDASKPFTTITLGRISSNDQRLYEKREGVFSNRETFMGVDWGGGERSYTVVTIFAYNVEGRFQLLYQKRYKGSEEQELDYQKEHIAQLMNTFAVRYCLVDVGYGAEQLQWLKKRFGARIDGCYYSFNQIKTAKYTAEKNHWVVNRSAAIGEYVEMVNNVAVLWPGINRHDYDYLFDHHLAEYSEYRKSQNGRSEDLMYNHPEGSADDGMHSCVYAYWASKLVKRSPAQSVEFSVAYGTR